MSAYCPLGNKGPLCAVCADGFRKGVTGSCVACDAQSRMEVADLLPVILIGLFVMLALAVCCTLRSLALTPLPAHAPKPRSSSLDGLCLATTRTPCVAHHCCRCVTSGVTPSLAS